MTTQLYHLLATPLYIAAFIGGLFLFYSLRINKDANVNFIRAGVLLISPCLLLLILAPDEQKIDRERIKRALTRTDVQLFLDGKMLDTVSAHELSDALKSIEPLPAHHSHPTDEKLIQILSSGDTVNITIGQDSNDSLEYWIYVNKPTHAVNETGRIRTQFFIKNSGL